MLCGNPGRRELTTWNYGALFLCGLLVVLCISARMARYDIYHRALKLPTTQSYVDGTEILRKLPKTTSPSSWQALAVAAFAVTTVQAIGITSLVWSVIPSKPFNPECCSRPPPVR